MSSAHAPALWSRFTRRPHCRTCGHLFPCPTALEGRYAGAAQVDAAERNAAIARLVDYGRTAFTEQQVRERELRANPGGHW